MASVEYRKDKNEKIISYRFRACCGRDDQKKQVWRTIVIPRFEEFTSKRVSDKEERAVKKKAQEWEREEIAKFQKTHSKTDKEKTTFEDFVKHHWKPDHVNNGKHAPNSKAFYDYTIATALSYFGKKKLSQIDVESVKRYINYLEKEAKTDKGKLLSSTSQMHHYSTFRNVMNYAYRLEYLSENPCDRISISEAPKRGKKQIDYLDQDEARHFIECVNQEFQEAEYKYNKKREKLKDGEENPEIGTLCRAAMWRCYMFLSITTGLRRGECIGLQWGDINSEKLSLTVCRSVCIDTGSSDRVTVKGTKTGENRTVPLLEQVCNMLEDYKAIYLHYFGKEDVEPTDFIFCKEDAADEPLYVTTPTRHVKAFTKRHGLRDISPHDLRHTVASLAVSNGAGLLDVAELMGHADIGTTRRFYAALTAEAKRRTVEGVGNIIFSMPK